MRLVVALVVFLVLEPAAYGRLGERRLPAGGRGGGHGKQVKVSMVKKVKVSHPQGQDKKGDRPIPPGLEGLDFELVEWDETNELFDSVELDAVLKAQRGYIKHMNNRIEAEKQEHDAAIDEDKAEAEEAEATKEEAQADGEAQKAAARKKLANARMEKQGAKERLQQAREKSKSLEATNDSTYETLMEAQEKYRVKLQERTLQAAIDTEEELKKDKDEGKDQDRTVWRTVMEDAKEAAKKDKTEVMKEAKAFKNACMAMEKSQARIVRARMAKLFRRESRLKRLEAKQMPNADKDDARKMISTLRDEDFVMAEASKTKAAEAKKMCKAITDSQRFLYDRVLNVKESMAKRELVRDDKQGAQEKYRKALEEKTAAENELLDAYKEEADANDGPQREALLKRLESLKEKAKSKDLLLNTAEEKMSVIQNTRMELVDSMVKEATEEDEDEKAGEPQTAEQREAILKLDRLQLAQTTRELTDEEGMKAIEDGQKQLSLVLDKKLGAEEAFVKKLEYEVDIAANTVDELGMEETSQTSSGDKQSKEKRRTALIETLEKKKAALDAAKNAREETRAEKAMNAEYREINDQSQNSIRAGEGYQKDLLTMSEKREQKALEQGGGDDGGN